MKAIGFLTVHSGGLKCARDLGDLLGNSESDRRRTAATLDFLKRGISLEMKFISDLYDTDGEWIGPYRIYTDGEWIWPSYFPFYLNKYPTMLLAEAFTNYVQARGHTDFQLSARDLKYAEYIVATTLFGVQIDISITRAVGIDTLISKRGASIECF